MNEKKRHEWKDKTWLKGQKMNERIRHEWKDKTWMKE